MAAEPLKQSHLGGRTRGLRPSQIRQLERLSHRRHPEEGSGDLLSLERLADLVVELELALHLVIDGRGLCRLLWLGPLAAGDSPVQHLPETPRRQSGGWRLISCPFSRQGLSSDAQESVMALDLSPRHWLRFAPIPAANGTRQAELLEMLRQHPQGLTTQVIQAQSFTRDQLKALEAKGLVSCHEETLTGPTPDDSCIQ